VIVTEGSLFCLLYSRPATEDTGFAKEKEFINEVAEHETVGPPSLKSASPGRGFRGIFEVKK
jgi:hypothetical protein